MSGTTEKTAGRGTAGRTLGTARAGEAGKTSWGGRETRQRLLRTGAALTGAAATGLGAQPVAAGGPTGGGGGGAARGLAVYLGTGGRGAGVHFLRMDRSTGWLTMVETTEAPTDGWITLDPAQRALYAGFRNNRVAGFRLD